MSDSVNALILAAGKGERLRPLTLFKAKPSLEFLNIPLLAYSYYWIEKLRPAHLAINLHHLPETIKTAVASFADHDIPTIWSDETQLLLQSGGGVAQAKQNLDRVDSTPRDWILANGDSVLLCDPKHWLRALDHHRKTKALATIILCPRQKSIPSLIWREEKNSQVVDIGHTQPTPTSTGWHYTGYTFISAEGMKHFSPKPSHIFTDVFLPLIRSALQKENPIIGSYVIPEAHWFETGDLKNYLLSTDRCLKILIEQLSFADVLRDMFQRFQPGWDNYKYGRIYSALALPKSLQISSACGLVARFAQIGDGVTANGFFVVGSNSRLGARCRLQDAVIMSHSHVQDDSLIKEKVIINN